MQHGTRTPREVLERLYETAHGASWHAKTHWLSSTVRVCRWRGIECSGGDMISIDLGGNGVAGTLPEELRSLRALRVLNIDESGLSGTLPRALASLTELRTILLASNSRLSGTLPDLRRLSMLADLDISRTRLSGSLPGAVARGLHGLQRLQLDHTSLSGALPTQIGALGHLEALFVHESPRLSGSLPTQVGRLQTLLHGFSMAGTRLSGTIPSELGRLHKLRQIWLVQTSLSGSVPPSLGAMHSLNQVELHGSRLEGSLPSQLGALSHLRTCVLTAAQGPHQALHGLRPADRVTTDTNHFACPIPPNLPAPCVPHLRCSPPPAPVEVGEAKRRGKRGKHRGRGARPREVDS
eukprot:1085235-Prymnesium_polylepis.1